MLNSFQHSLCVTFVSFPNILFSTSSFRISKSHLTISWPISLLLPVIGIFLHIILIGFFVIISLTVVCSGSAYAFATGFLLWRLLTPIAITFFVLYPQNCLRFCEFIAVILLNKLRFSTYFISWVYYLG